jgi:hypothetical protein
MNDWIKVSDYWFFNLIANILAVVLLLYFFLGIAITIQNSFGPDEIEPTCPEGYKLTVGTKGSQRCLREKR